MSSTPTAKARALVFTAWVMLLLLVWWRQLVQGVNAQHILLAVIFNVPLLAPLRGLVQDHRHTYRWATLCVLPYFVVGVTESVASVSIRLWASALLGAALLWFFALISYLRITAHSH